MSVDILAEQGRSGGAGASSGFGPTAFNALSPEAETKTGDLARCEPNRTPAFIMPARRLSLAGASLFRDIAMTFLCRLRAICRAMFGVSLRPVPWTAEPRQTDRGGCALLEDWDAWHDGDISDAWERKRVERE